MSQLESVRERILWPLLTCCRSDLSRQLKVGYAQEYNYSGSTGSNMIQHLKKRLQADMIGAGRGEMLAGTRISNPAKSPGPPVHPTSSYDRNRANFRSRKRQNYTRHAMQRPGKNALVNHFRGVLK